MTHPVRPFGGEELFAPTGSEARNFDSRAEAEFGVSGTTLMESAGRAAAAVIQRRYPRGRVVVLAGAGNNGGDAVVVARTLLAWGRPVVLVEVGSGVRSELTHGWTVERADPATLTLNGDDVLVDGILGTGLSGAPRPATRDWILRCNQFAGSTVSLDVPSGVDADTGAVPGVAVGAQLTVAFGWPKLGSLLHPARSHCGRMVAVEIGFPPVQEPFPARLITPGWFHRFRPERTVVTHKNQVGSLLVIAGRSGMAGAAIIAARSALRAGAGLVRIASSLSNREILQEAVPEAVFLDSADGGLVSEALNQSKAVLVGPGLGTDAAARRVLDQVLDAGGAPLVLDADALNLMADRGPETVSRVGGGRPLLLTPHPGEMGRLLGGKEAGAVTDPAAAREFAARAGCAVLLKGTPSTVAAPDGSLLVGTQGSSDLATAGMGDLLAGAAGALMAQGSPPATAGGAALYLTGRAANLAASGRSLVPQDVVERMVQVWRETGVGTTDLDLPCVIFDQDPPR